MCSELLRRRCNSHAWQCPPHARDRLERLLYVAPDEEARVVDHDTDARLVRSKMGYFVQLWDSIASQAAQWRLRGPERASDILLRIEVLRDMHVPPEWRIPGLTAWKLDWIGYVYINPKKSCFNDGDPSGRLNCTLDHPARKESVCKTAMPSQKEESSCRPRSQVFAET